MNDNHIEVNHSNGVTIVYTEGPLLVEDDYWRRRRRVTWKFLGLIVLGVILLDGRLVPALLACIAVAGTAWLCVKVCKAVLASDERYRARVAAIAARADAQHAALMHGDQALGVYGAYPPAPIPPPYDMLGTAHA